MVYNNQNVQGSTKRYRHTNPGETRAAERSGGAQRNLQTANTQRVRGGKRNVRTEERNHTPVPNNSSTRTLHATEPTQHRSTETKHLPHAKHARVRSIARDERVQPNRHNVTKFDINKIDKLLQSLSQREPKPHRDETLHLLDLYIDTEVLDDQINLTIRGFCSNANQWHHEVTKQVLRVLAPKIQYMVINIEQLIIFDRRDTLLVITELYPYVCERFPSKISIIPPSAPFANSTCTEAFNTFQQRRRELLEHYTNNTTGFQK